MIDKLNKIAAEVGAYIQHLEDQVAKLNSELDGLQPAPPTPPDVEYEGTAKLGNYTIEQYEAMSWTTQQLLEGGYIKIKAAPVVEEPPTPPEAIDPPPVPEIKEPQEIVVPPPIVATYEIAGTTYKMAPKAGGADKDQFAKAGWEDEDLIKEGYLVPVGVDPTPDAPEAPPEDAWPRKNDAGEYIDSAGTTFNDVKHGMSKGNVPAVTVKGVFKKKKGYKEPAPGVEEPPTPPGVPESPSLNVPSAPEVAEVPSAPTLGDEPSEDELAALIKDW